MMVVCFFWDLTKCLRLCANWNKSSGKGRTGKKNVAVYICTHVTCIEPCATSRQGQNVRKRVLSLEVKMWEKECCLLKSKCERMGYWKSWVYIANPCHVVGSKHTVYFAYNKIKGADVVESTNHVTFLTNGFSRRISLPTSTIFVSGTSESVSCFVELSGITAILKI